MHSLPPLPFMVEGWGEGGSGGTVVIGQPYHPAPLPQAGEGRQSEVKRSLQPGSFEPKLCGSNGAAP
ncbi:hypothetical protein PSEUDO8O_120452 [Pseudomonas sp. 8O]|nr:hypothetical protein PSEUDO8O_120452 [Pseudomonas sp. 8O]